MEELFELLIEPFTSPALLERGVEPEPVSRIAFDPAEEVLWAAGEGGTLSTFSMPTLAKYASSRAHFQPVKSLVALGGHALSASADVVRVHTVGCVPTLTIPDSDADILAAALLPTIEGAVIGRAAAYLQTLDLHTGKLGPRVASSQGCQLFATSGRAVICGGVNGEISVRDPRTGLRAESAITAHNGAVIALDHKADLVVSSGLQPLRGAGQQGLYAFEPVVKVFDIRATLRPLHTVSCLTGPSMLQFLPRFSSTILIGSASGVVSIADIGSGGVISAQYVLSVDNAQAVCVSVSPTGQGVAFGDSGSLLHLWGTQESPECTLYPAYPEPPADDPVIDNANEEELCGPVTWPYAYGDNSQLLSDFDPGSWLRVGLPPHAIDRSLTKASKQARAEVDFVKYVANPKYSRGQPFGEATKAIAPVRNARVRKRKDGDGAAQLLEANALPKMYHLVEIKHNTGLLRFLEFDFGAHNRTRLAGLENDLANCYINPLIQALYYLPHLRTAALGHLCDREICMLCEMAFLFHMLGQGAHIGGGGKTCQASNLLRSLRQVREAAALGLLDLSTDPDPSRPDANMPKRVQALSRFLLEQLSKEEGGGAAAAGGAGGPAGAVERIFGSTIRQKTVCTHCQQAATRTTRSLQLDLVYPDTTQQAPSGGGEKPAPPGSPARPGGDASAAEAEGGVKAVGAGGGRPSFAELLQASLRQEFPVRSWCDTDRAYHRMLQSKEVANLPQVMVVGCGMRDLNDLQWWGVAPSAVAAAQRITQKSKDMTEEELVEAIREATRRVDEHWLPMALRVRAGADGRMEVEQASDTVAFARDPLPAGKNGVVFELASVVSHVQEYGATAAKFTKKKDRARLEEGHVIAHVRVVDKPGGSLYSTPAGPAQTPGVSPLPIARRLSTSEGSATAAAAAIAAAAPATPERGGKAPPSTTESGPLPAGGAGAGLPPRSPHTPQHQRADGHGGLDTDWVVVNDFAVTPTLQAEVSQLYGLLPQVALSLCAAIVRLAQFIARSPPTSGCAKVVTEQVFRSLTLGAWPPPLPPPSITFRPLDMTGERPGPAMHLGLDAEFVSLAPPEVEVRPDGTEVELRPARLTLARVSVVRANPGPKRLQPCIDDYIRAVEPVYDYLTKFSGITHGDLDPGLSRHHLTTLKAAYLKLRYLCDCGVKFVGHGLRKDFRMINIVVPPEQIIDTVELFHFKRQRKFSLRFLSSYLLGIDIQGQSHDSIEDARTACLLYAKYQELVAAGTFKDTLLEMYRHGKIFGWDVAVNPAGPGQQGPGLQQPPVPAAPMPHAPPPGMGARSPHNAQQHHHQQQQQHAAAMMAARAAGRGGIGLGVPIAGPFFAPEPRGGPPPGGMLLGGGGRGPFPPGAGGGPLPPQQQQQQQQGNGRHGRRHGGGGGGGGSHQLQTALPVAQPAHALHHVATAPAAISVMAHGPGGGAGRHHQQGRGGAGGRAGIPQGMPLVAPPLPPMPRPGAGGR